jgi:hypothetical protein
VQQVRERRADEAFGGKTQHRLGGCGKTNDALPLVQLNDAVRDDLRDGRCERFDCEQFVEEIAVYVRR